MTTTTEHNKLEEIENRLLGIILNDETKMGVVADELKVEYFYFTKSRLLFKKMLELYKLDMPINIYALLEDKQIDSDYLLKLSTIAMLSGDILKIADYITRDYIKRSMRNIASDFLQKDPNVEEVFSTIEQFESDIFQLATHGIRGDNFKNAFEATKEFRKVLEHNFQHKQEMLGVSTGFQDINKLTGGMQNSDLIILAGRPSMGKTSLALNMAYNACLSFLKSEDTSSSVGFFSLEMSTEQLMTRLISVETGINSFKIRTGKISDEEFANIMMAANKIQKIQLFIDDTASANISSIKSKARKLHRRKKLKILFIDYLQLISVTSKKQSENRVNEIAEITMGLKGLAKELGIPIVALSQLSRAVEQREDKRPQLSDLRESGTIEQDSDVVMFVYREEYYLKRLQPREGTESHREWQAKMNDIINQAEVIIAKQRNGPIGNIRMHFDSSSTSFTDLYTGETHT